MAQAGRSSRLHDIRVLYLREVRSALRERTIVVNSILIPVLLYPFILWAAFTGLTFVQGQTEGYRSRIMVTGWPQHHAALRREIERDTRFQIVPSMDRATAERQLGSGDLDAVAVFVSPAPDARRAASIASGSPISPSTLMKGSPASVFAAASRAR